MIGSITGFHPIPKVYALGHRHNAGIMDGPVIIQEKIDGSQFSFGWVQTSIGPALECRSKGAIINSDPGMFNHAVATAQALFENGLLMEGCQYQCEYLAKPKHNVLAYACIPAGHLVLFDVRDADGRYHTPAEPLEHLAAKLGIQAAPLFFSGPGTQLMPSDLTAMLERESVLGGSKIEGIVIKNYSKAHPESQSGSAPMTAKLVSEKFKEKHASSPINSKAAPNDVVQCVINRYRTEARWLKAIQHLKERGTLVNGPEDIGPLLAEIKQDTLEEDGHDIAEVLAAPHWPAIFKGITAGFPEYYKALLAGGLSVWQQEQFSKMTQTNEKENS